MPKRERPRQRFWPVPFQDMQVGAAHPAGPDLDERGFFRDFRPWHLADHRGRAGAIIGADSDLGHEFFLAGASAMSIAVVGRANYLKSAAMPILARLIRD